MSVTFITVEIPWEEWKRLADFSPPGALQFDDQGSFMQLERLVLRPVPDRSDLVRVEFLTRTGTLSNDTLLKIKQAFGLSLIER